MNLLAIETSNPFLSVAFQKEPGPIRKTAIEGYLRHSENLIPVIDALLRKEKVFPNEIDVFLIGRGPGSFTGLRIGFATLKGFLSQKKRACYGATSLDILAEGIVLPDGAQLGVCVDARREKIYAHFYKRIAGRWQRRKTPVVLSFNQVAQFLAPGAFVVGDALARYEKEFKALETRKKIRCLPKEHWYPEAATLIRLYHERVKKGRTVSSLEPMKNPRDFIPLYFRLAEAEEKKKRR